MTVQISAKNAPVMVFSMGLNKLVSNSALDETPNQLILNVLAMMYMEI